jgi:DNA-binding transcriptional ArsR family regulator
MRANDTSKDPLCVVPCFKEDLVARLRQAMPPDEAFDDAGALFGALADRTRLKLLVALAQVDELCVCDVANVLGTSVSGASHHLRKLRDLKILRHRADGKMSYYALRDPLVAELVRRVFGPSLAGDASRQEAAP